MQVKSGVVWGVTGLPITVRATAATPSAGMQVSDAPVPWLAIDGLSEAAAEALKATVMLALRASGLARTQARVRVLVDGPMTQRKRISGLALPVALAYLVETGQIEDPSRLNSWLLVGALGLDGEILSVDGAIPLARLAHHLGLGIILPPDLAGVAEIAACALSGLDVCCATSLQELAHFFNQRTRLRQPITGSLSIAPEIDDDLADLRLDAHVRRALEICAAGGHNLLMVGQVDDRLSAVARRLHTLLKPMTPHQALETMTAHSAARMLGPRNTCGLRPFRCPHPSISDVGLFGGGYTNRPGEVALAHNGVLFLPDLPRYRPDHLARLQRVMQAGEVSLGDDTTAPSAPADFLLVASTRLCPCSEGTTEERGHCRCSPQEVGAYRTCSFARGGPRFDVQVRVQGMGRSSAGVERSATVAERVFGAHQRQQQRAGAAGARALNGRVDLAQMREGLNLSAGARVQVERQISAGAFSVRTYEGLLRVSRTIADLAGSDDVEAEHVAEASTYMRA